MHHENTVDACSTDLEPFLPPRLAEAADLKLTDVVFVKEGWIRAVTVLKPSETSQNNFKVLALVPSRGARQRWIQPLLQQWGQEPYYWATRDFRKRSTTLLRLQLGGHPHKLLQRLSSPRLGSGEAYEGPNYTKVSPRKAQVWLRGDKI